MASKALFVLLLAVFVGAFAFTGRQKKWYNLREENPVEPPLVIGSFNIQTFGPKKYNDRDIMFVIEKVIQRYDLILILESMFIQPHFMKNLLKDINRSSKSSYAMTESERHNRTSEHSVIFYKTEKLRIYKNESYNDPLEKFYRKPFVVIFDALTLRDVQRFGVIGHHVKPSQAVQEIDALANVYDAVKEKYKVQDVLLMGDFNADCAYVKEDDWHNINLWTRSEFTWAIGDHIDTTTNYKSCALDRIVYAGENLNNGVILGSAGVYDFKQEFELTTKEVQRISDHWPIEIRVRGKMSKTAEQHLTSLVCFSVHDSRSRSFNTTEKAIQNEARAASFFVTTTKSGVELKLTAKQADDILDGVRALRKRLPGVVTGELLKAIEYKYDYDSLDDQSSHADIQNPGHSLRILSNERFTDAVVCRDTTIN